MNFFKSKSRSDRNREEDLRLPHGRFLDQAALRQLLKNPAYMPSKSAPDDGRAYYTTVNALTVHGKALLPEMLALIRIGSLPAIEAPIKALDELIRKSEVPAKLVLPVMIERAANKSSSFELRVTFLNVIRSMRPSASAPLVELFRSALREDREELNAVVALIISGSRSPRSFKVLAPEINESLHRSMYLEDHRCSRSYLADALFAMDQLYRYKDTPGVEMALAERERLDDYAYVLAMRSERDPDTSGSAIRSLNRATNLAHAEFEFALRPPWRRSIFAWTAIQARRAAVWALD